MESIQRVTAPIPVLGCNQTCGFCLTAPESRKQMAARPRVHDFRHGFAVNALIRWYRAGVDVQAKLPLLATWLGHVSILSTYHYLHFVEDLRRLPTSRFIDSYGSVVVPVPQKGGDR